MQPSRIAISVAASLALAGCAAAVPESGPPRPAASAPATRPAAPSRARVPRHLPRTATRQNLPGLEAVIGARAADLVRMFGPARLDIVEGDARKLQFEGSACVLDVYLYPPAEGREPETTYVDARRSDGLDVDRAACVAALRQR